MADTQQDQQADAQTEVEHLSIGGLIATRVYADFQQATDFADFYRFFKLVFAHYALEATEHRAHRCHGFSVAQSLNTLLVECLLKAQLLAGEGAAFVTMRAHFMETIDVQFRLFAKLHTYPVPKAFAAEVRADFERQGSTGRLH